MSRVHPLPVNILLLLLLLLLHMQLLIHVPTSNGYMLQPQVHTVRVPLSNRYRVLESCGPTSNGNNSLRTTVPSILPLPASTLSFSTAQSIPSSETAATAATTILLSSSSMTQPLSSIPSTDSIGITKVARRKRILACYLAFWTALVNVACLTQFSTFTTMLSGNVLWLARAMVQHRAMLITYYITVVAAYTMGLAITRKCKPSLSQNTNVLRLMAATVMMLFTAADCVYYTLHLSRWLPVCLLAMAYGIVNSIGAACTGTLTFVVTGHWTKLTHMCVDRFVDGRIWNVNDWIVVKQSILVTLSFLAGGLVAAQGLGSWLSRWGVFTAVGVAYGVGIGLYREDDESTTTKIQSE